MNIDDSKAEKPKLTPLRLSAVSEDAHFDIENETLIGREVECTITLPSPHVSRYHAKINVSDSGLTIEDLNSANGTFVNGKRISEKTAISLGDELRFDSLAYRITGVDSGQSDATVLVSQKAILDKVEAANTANKAQNDRPAAVSPSIPANTPAEDEDDGTRILSQDQLSNAANINQQAQSFKDSGSGPRLVATTAPIRGQVFPILTTDSQHTWRLGRSKENEICVSAPSVSRLHSIISKRDGRFHIEANDAAKPFMLNKMPQTTAMLKHNDHLQIGSTELIFRLDEASRPNTSKRIEEEEYSPTKTILVAAGTMLAVLVIAIIVLMNKTTNDEQVPKPNTLPATSESVPSSNTSPSSNE